MGVGERGVGSEERQLEDVLSRPNVARIYDCLLGGKDNLSVDREVAARVAEAQPLAVAGVRANRAFVRRAVAFLARSGIAQFIDLGSGLPTGENVHAIAGRVNPTVRVVYVDYAEVVVMPTLADQPRSVGAVDLGWSA